MDLIPSSTTIALVVPLVILLAIWLLLLMIQPIFVVIDCAFSRLPITRKIAWLAIMFFSLGLATTFYPYMVSESRFLRWITIISYLPLLLLPIIYIFLYLQYPEIQEAMDGYLEYASALLLGKTSVEAIP